MQSHRLYAHEAGPAPNQPYHFPPACPSSPCLFCPSHKLQYKRSCMDSWEMHTQSGDKQHLFLSEFFYLMRFHIMVNSREHPILLWVLNIKPSLWLIPKISLLISLFPSLKKKITTTLFHCNFKHISSWCHALLLLAVTICSCFILMMGKGLRSS